MVLLLYSVWVIRVMTKRAVASTFQLFIILILVTGCTRVGPDMMYKDRFDYTTAVGDSWKEQVLLNIVRIRYSDWPTFVAVDQIITAYTMEHTGTARLIGKRGISDVLTNDQAEAGWVGKFAERPTILYKPLSGQKYVNSMLTPTKPASVLALIESGWPADHLSRIALRSVNGKYNTNAEYGVMHRTDKGFALFITTLKMLQAADAMKVSIKKVADKGEQVYLNIQEDKLTAPQLQQLRELKVELGLAFDKNRYRIVRDSADDSSEEILIQGRSLLQVLVALSTGVEIPNDHLLSDVAPPLRPIPEKDLTSLSPLMVIKSSPSNPGDTYVAVRYLNMWFWIDKTDHFSKRSLQYALTLITLLDSDDKAGGSVVIPVN